jgi:hypothetical protein
VNGKVVEDKRKMKERSKKGGRERRGEKGSEAGAEAICEASMVRTIGGNEKGSGLIIRWTLISGSVNARVSRSVG